jgi:hypothetical protein
MHGAFIILILNQQWLVRFEVFTAMSMKKVLRNVGPNHNIYTAPDPRR